MDRSREYAGVLLQKAREDAWIFDRLAQEPDAPVWGLGFHAQQAAEKAIKAVLAARGTEYPHTHNLHLLLALLEDTGADLPPDAPELPRLTPFSAILRYDQPAEPPSAKPVDLGRLRTVVGRTIAWAESLVGASTDF